MNNALDTFIAKHVEIEKMLNRIKEAHDDHYGANAEDITWGEVAEISAVESKLKDLTDMLFLEGEYSE